MTWAPNYTAKYQERIERLQAFRADPSLLAGAKAYYRDHLAEFIDDWVDTYDPRNAGLEGKLTTMPFILFPRQKDYVNFTVACLEANTSGLTEKCRDAGVTWLGCSISVALWLFFPGVAIGWGSRKQELVDKIGVMDSIFEKMRFIIRRLPPEFLPWGFSDKDHLTYMRCLNPETGSVIVGECGDNIGRGGRTRIYFKDESAHYERPELIEAALGDNTRVQMDISSVNGLGNVFHRKREAGVVWNGGAVEKGKTNVFIFDWRDHPGKTEEWYDERKTKAINEGMAHIFAQEVDRDYSSSVQGIIIPADWVRAAIDADKKLGFSDDGAWSAALDVADEGLDRNSLAQRKGVVLKAAEDWGQGDTGQTTRRAVQLLRQACRVQYDCIGVGAGVKAESNRLKAEKLLKPGTEFIAWNAGSAPFEPDLPIIKGDKQSPTNGDHYANLKAQSWWRLRERFFKTWQYVTKGVVYPFEELISIDSSIPQLHQLTKELSQATSSLSTGKMKIVVDKSPNGTRSPNLADSVVMLYNPVKSASYTLENL